MAVENLLGKKGGGGGIEPTGTLNITENGVFDVTNYASADVDVPGAVIPERDTSATTATPSSVLDGYDFYGSDNTKQTGTVQSMAGGTYTSNQTIPTANKYMTSDIVVNVPDGNTRLQNDTLYKMKAIDYIMSELSEVLKTDFPTDAEYVIQAAYVDSIMSEIDANITNFTDYALLKCRDFIVTQLQLQGVPATKNMTLDTLVQLVSNAGLNIKSPANISSRVSDTTATADKVYEGRKFYLSNGNLAYGTIPGRVGRNTDINQTIPVAGKYLTADIEIQVPAGGTDPNELMKEMMSDDITRYNLGIIGLDGIPTMTEYVNQQTYVTNLINKITGGLI